MPSETNRHTFTVSLVLCLVCSFLVSGAAVLLRDLQEENVANSRRRNILMAAFPLELPDEGSFAEFYSSRNVAGIAEYFEEHVVSFRVDLQDGETVPTTDAERDYDQVKAAKNPGREPKLDLRQNPQRDLAGIKAREDVGWVYVVRDDHEGVAVETIVLPIRGYGLWSTLKGFLAIDAKALARGPAETIVRGLTYYEHGETPGLGGEVDNPTWKAKWPGRRVFDSEWNVKLQVTKNPVGDFDVDALTGATITSTGVSRMLKFWLGSDGYGNYLRRRASAVLSAGRAGRGGTGG